MQQLNKINKNNNSKKTIMESKTQTGTVKFYQETKGFGFIVDENGNDIFVHATGLEDDIRQNDKVTFETKDGKKGITAVKVRKVK